MSKCSVVPLKVFQMKRKRGKRGVGLTSTATVWISLVSNMCNTDNLKKITENHLQFTCNKIFILYILCKVFFFYFRYIQNHYSRLICTHTAPDEMCRISCNVWGVSAFQNTLKLWEIWPPLFPPSSPSLELPTLSRTLQGSLAQLEKLC